MAKLCPECLTPLDHKIHKVFECWVCPDGHGTFYPKGELEKIVGVISGLGRLEMRIWNDHDRYSVNQAQLIGPDAKVPMLEIHDRDFPNILVYADPVSHGLWLHTGEEEKLVDHIERETKADSVSSYLLLAAAEAAKVFDDDEPLAAAAGHTLTALKLLGERILRAIPHITF